MKRLVPIVLVGLALALAGTASGSRPHTSRATFRDAVRVGPGGDLFPSGAEAQWRMALASLRGRHSFPR